MILSPYNTLVKNPFKKPIKLREKLYQRKEDIITFEPRVKQYDIQYEKENNREFDHGIYNTEMGSEVSKSRSGIFSQKSRTRTLTSKPESRGHQTTGKGYHETEDDEHRNAEIFNQFGATGVQSVQLDHNKSMQIDYNLIYALRRFGYPYEYTIR